MKKIILFLAFCWCFAIAGASAQVFTENYGQVILLSQTDDDGNTAYGLKKKGKKLLPVRYNVAICKELQIMAFYAGHELYLYDSTGKLLDYQYVEFKFDKDAYVDFEPIKARADVPCYELTAYYFSNSWVYDRFGIYYNLGGHLYRITRPKAELMN